ncbi:Ribonuclease R [Serratia symbiotica]|nr:Ribonuclease R [Serratia symbiotica]
MSQDLFIEREIKKYKSPIPSREYIISYLEKQKKPISFKILTIDLKLTKKEQIKALKYRLCAMERDNQIIFIHHKYYILSTDINLLRGTVISHRNGYGFLRTEDNQGDLYLSNEQMKVVILGDIVLAQELNFNQKKRREARIIRILIPKNTHIIGRFFINSNQGFVVPNDNRLNFNILIPPTDFNGAKIGYIVVVKLIKRPSFYKKAIGKIIEIIGNKININIITNIALRTYEIPHHWPPQVEEQINNLKKNIPEINKKGRVDLRKLPLVTIDNEDTYDFDDAVYGEKKYGGGWKLWVAIADVSYYVRIHTALDNEARNRATSVYFPSQVIPMLPELLSHELCSLNPKVDRFCMVCEMTLSSQGKLLKAKFYEAIMTSHARLTYNKVWRILQGDKSLRKYYYPLVNHLEELYTMYKVLDHERTKRGGIIFDTHETKFIFDSKHHIKRIEPVIRNDAHKLIEECMIMANISAAKFVEKNNEPALFRVHDRPNDNNILTLRNVLHELGLVLGGGNKPQPKDFSIIIDKISKRPDCEMLKNMLLRSMKQAIYDPENRGHFGLALSSYSHFTSPIRRYSDLVLHRAIKYQLFKKQIKFKGCFLPTGGYHSKYEEMLKLGVYCSIAERRADKATRNVSDWLKCDFMKNHIGSVFSGIIANVTNFGFFVRLKDLFIDGLVHISSLDNDHYYYNNINQCLIGKYSGIIHRIGDIVKIRVEAVHINQRKINLLLISNNKIKYNIQKNKKNYTKKYN